MSWEPGSQVPKEIPPWTQHDFLVSKSEINIEKSVCFKISCLLLRIAKWFNSWFPILDLSLVWINFSFENYLSPEQLVTVIGKYTLSIFLVWKSNNYVLLMQHFKDIKEITSLSWVGPSSGHIEASSCTKLKMIELSWILLLHFVVIMQLDIVLLQL